MKKINIKNLIIFVGIILVTLISCDNKPQQKQHQVCKAKQNKDNIARVNVEAEKARMTFEDSVAGYAWGDVKFGMTPKEVLQTKAFKGATKYDYGISMSNANIHAIEESLFLRSSLSIWAYFGGENNNELKEITVSGSDSWERFKYLIEDLQRLMARFKGKYGQPQNVFTDLESLEYMDLDKKNHIIIAEWIIGSGKTINGRKVIDIEMSTYLGTSYQYKIMIHNHSFPKHPKKKTKEELDEDRIKAHNIKEVIENSF